MISFWTLRPNSAWNARLTAVWESPTAAATSSAEMPSQRCLSMKTSASESQVYLTG